MDIKPKIAIGPMDRPVVLKDNEILEGQHFVLGAGGVGRVLFTEPPVAVEVDGQNVVIKDCRFEVL